MPLGVIGGLNWPQAPGVLQVADQLTVADLPPETTALSGIVFPTTIITGGGLAKDIAFELDPLEDPQAMRPRQPSRVHPMQKRLQQFFMIDLSGKNRRPQAGPDGQQAYAHLLAAGRYTRSVTDLLREQNWTSALLIFLCAQYPERPESGINRVEARLPVRGFTDDLEDSMPEARAATNSSRLRPRFASGLTSREAEL